MGEERFKQDFAVRLLRGIGLRLRNLSHFFLAQAETRADRPVPDSSAELTASVTDGPPAHWLERVKAAGPPLHWMERVAQAEAGVHSGMEQSEGVETAVSRPHQEARSHAETAQQSFIKPLRLQPSLAPRPKNPHAPAPPLPEQERRDNEDSIDHSPKLLGSEEHPTPSFFAEDASRRPLRQEQSLNQTHNPRHISKTLLNLKGESDSSPILEQKLVKAKAIEQPPVLNLSKRPFPPPISKRPPKLAQSLTLQKPPSHRKQSATFQQPTLLPKQGSPKPPESHSDLPSAKQPALNEFPVQPRSTKRQKPAHGSQFLPTPKEQLLPNRQLSHVSQPFIFPDGTPRKKVSLYQMEEKRGNGRYPTIPFPSQTSTAAQTSQPQPKSSNLLPTWPPLPEKVADTAINWEKAEREQQRRRRIDREQRGTEWNM